MFLLFCIFHGDFEDRNIQRVFCIFLMWCLNTQKQFLHGFAWFRRCDIFRVVNCIEGFKDFQSCDFEGRSIDTGFFVHCYLTLLLFIGKSLHGFGPTLGLEWFPSPFVCSISRYLRIAPLYTVRFHLCIHFQSLGSGVLGPEPLGQCSFCWLSFAD